MEAAENAFDAAYDGLSKFKRWKTQKKQNSLKDCVKIHDVDLFYTREAKRLGSLHANVKEGLNQLLVQLSLLKPPPAAQLEAVEGKLESARLVMQEAKKLSSEVAWAINNFDVEESHFDKMEFEILAKVKGFRQAETDQVQCEQQAELERLLQDSQGEVERLRNMVRQAEVQHLQREERQAERE